MNYLFVRRKIASGDLIAVRHANTPQGWLARVLTGTPYRHTGIAIWIDGGLWLAEISWHGPRLVPLSLYAFCDWDVFGSPINPALVVEIAATLRGVAEHTLLEYLQIMARRKYRAPLKHDMGRLVLSAYVRDVYQLAVASTVVSMDDESLTESLISHYKFSHFAYPEDDYVD